MGLSVFVVSSAVSCAGSGAGVSCQLVSVMKQVIGGVSVRVDRSVGYGLTMCMKPLTLSIQSSKSLSSGSGSSSG